MMQEKILFNVLKNVGTGSEYASAPDKTYLEALQEIGMISMGWDNEITAFGKTILEYLRNKLNP